MHPTPMRCRTISWASNGQRRFAPIFGSVFLFTLLPLAGCGGADSGSAPAITAQPAGITVAERQSASFSVTALGTAPLIYAWRRNGTPIAGATSATLTMTSALAADHGARFSAVVNNSAGSVTSAEAVLTEELPMFLLAGQSNTEGNVDTALFQMLLADLASAANTDTKARLAERIRTERRGRFAAVRLIALNQMRQRVRPRTGVWSGLEPGRVLGHIADQGRSRRNESLR